MSDSPPKDPTPDASPGSKKEDWRTPDSINQSECEIQSKRLRPNVTPKMKATYCNTLRASGEAALARRDANISQHTLSYHLRKDPQFRDDVEEAMRLYCAENIGQEIHRRGVVGVRKALYWRGNVVGYMVEPSDRLLLAHAKRHMPEYRDQISIDQKVETKNADLSLDDLQDLSPESLELLKQIVENEKKRKASPSPEPDPQ